MTQGGATARSDLHGGVGWMVFGLAIVAGAWRMDRFEAMGATLYTAPGLVPGLLGAMLVLMGGALALRSRRVHGGAADGTAPERLLNRRIVLMLLLTLGYAAGAAGRLPFVASTIVFVALFTALYAEGQPWPRRVAVALASGAFTALAVVLVFERIFLVRLP